MKKETLTDTQAKILKMANDQGRFTTQDLPVKGAASQKVIDSLLRKSLIRVTEAKDAQEVFALTFQGRKAIGIEEPEEIQTTPPKPKARPGSKLDQVIKMLSRPEGATITQIMKQNGWLRHTVHGTLAGALKKRLGLSIASEKRANKEHIYRIIPQETNA